MGPGILLNSNEAHSSKNEKYKIKSTKKYKSVTRINLFWKVRVYFVWVYIF